MRAIGLEAKDLFPDHHPGRRAERPKAGWSWKPKEKDRSTIDTEKLTVQFASIAFLKLLYPVNGSPPQADEAASEAIAPYNAIYEDLWHVYTQRQSHEDVQAAG